MEFVVQNKNQQHLMSRTTEYSVGKGERVAESVKKYLNYVIDYSRGFIINDAYITMVRGNEGICWWKLF